MGFDLVSVSEHWLKNDEGEFYSSLNDKKLISIFCRSIYKNGGTAIFARNQIECNHIDLSRYCLEKTFEISGVEVVGRNLTVLNVYRSPSGEFSAFIDLLDQCLSYLTASDRILVMGGDFNIHLNRETVEAVHFRNLLRTYGLYLATTEPTRDGICLDSVATNIRQDSYVAGVTEPVIADHSAVLFRFSASLVSPITLPWHADYVFSYRVINDEVISKFYSALQVVDWKWVCTLVHGFKCFDIFFDLFCVKFNESFPLKVKKFRTRDENKGKNSSKNLPKIKDWYSPELARLRVVVLACNDRMKTAVDVQTKHEWFTRYLHVKRAYRVQVAIAKKNSNTEFIQNANNSCKAAWSLINVHRKLPVSMACKSSPDDINSYFIKTVSEIVDVLPDGPVVGGLLTTNPNVSLTKWRFINAEELVKIVKGFKVTTSTDVYGMSVKVLKEVIGVLAQPLSHLVNVCLVEGRFPDSLKIARVVPVYKKGDRSLVSSYRPIAIIPAFAKIFETVMKTQLLEYFESNKLFSAAQHGFRKGRSTTSALLDVAGKVLQAYENGEAMAVTLCDLTKAFDVVSHDLLLAKMPMYGIGGAVLKMLSSYLDCRWQVVSVNGAVSGRRKVNHGVPQGSVLGPLLFLIMVNDFAGGRSALLFADDTTLLTKGASIEEVKATADSDLEDAMEWFRENKLFLNEAKTQKLICTLGHGELEGAPTVKLLGFVIDGKLSWEAHICEVGRRLSRVIYLFRKLRCCVREDYLLTAYHGLFHSHLAYGLLLWGHAAGCSQLLKLQKKVVRLMTWSGDREHCRPIFHRLDILTVISHYIMISLLHVHENLNLYNQRKEIHGYNTRNRTKLDVPRCRLSKSLDRFPNLALRCYNKLPEEVKSLGEKCFRKVLKTWLLAAAYYSLQEFFDDNLQGLVGVYCHIVRPPVLVN